MRSQPPEHPRAEVESRSLLARVKELPVAERLAFHRALTEDLGGHLGEELEREREIRRRHEAIEAMRQASRLLDLPGERAPNAQEYREAARQTTLPLSFDAVHGAFDGRWGLARDAYDGVPIPPTAAQRAIAREAHRAGAAQDPIVGLQAFLAEMPEGVALVGADYHRWAREHNERRALGEARGPRLIERPITLWRRLLLPWDEMLRVARGEMTMAEARAAILDSCELASHPQVQAIFGEAHPERWPGFPEPLPLTASRWWRDDLRAYQEGKRFTDEDMRASRARYKAGRTREQREIWGAEAVALEKRRRAQLGEGEPPEAVREREERLERMRLRAKERQAARAEREERVRVREERRARAAEARERKERERHEAEERKERERRQAEEMEAVRARFAAWEEREDRRPRANRELDDLLPEGWKPRRTYNGRRYGGRARKR